MIAFEWICTMFALLMFGHFLADYPLQGDFLARAKNPNTHALEWPGMPPAMPWWQAMLAHSAIHAGMVGIITGMLWLAIAELIAHFIIDTSKCNGSLTFNQDQLLHAAFKLVFTLITYQAAFA